MPVQSRAQVIQRQGANARQTRAVRRGGGGGGSVAQFLAPHTGRQAGRIANAEAGTEFNPAIRESRQQAKGSRQRQADIGHWYSQLAGDYGASQAAGNTAFKTAQDAVSKQLAEAGGRGQAEVSELAGKDASLAALVGGPTNAAGISQAAQAGSAAERARVGLTAPIAGNQASYLASLGGRRTAARMQGIEARKEEGQRREKILSNLAAARKEKGQAKVGNLEKIRESDRGFALEQRKMAQAKREAAISAQQARASLAVTQANLQRQVQAGQISAQQAQERLAIEAKNAQTTRRSQQVTAQHYKTSKTGGLTASEKRTIQERHQNAVATGHSLVKASGHGYPTSAKGWAQLEEAIRKESEVSAAAARAAVARMKAEQGKAARNPFPTRAAMEQAAGGGPHR
jgi:hypothetical protein